MRLVGHVASVGVQKRFIHGFGWETRGTTGLEELSVHGKIIFKWKFKKKDWGRGCELDWFG
jgi:hypothetical protein